MSRSTEPSLWQGLRAGVLSVRFLAALASAAAAFLAVYFLARHPAGPAIEQAEQTNVTDRPQPDKTASAARQITP